MLCRSEINATVNIRVIPHSHLSWEKRPNLGRLQIFASECIAFDHDLRGKLDERCKEGIFMGFDKFTPAYLVSFPDTPDVRKHRIVDFFYKS